MALITAGRDGCTSVTWYATDRAGRDGCTSVTWYTTDQLVGMDVLV